MPDLPAFTHALLASAHLLAAHPGFWLLFVLVFLVLVEGLMFLPRIGFVVKTAVGAVLGAQALLLFATAAAGGVPSLGQLLGVLHWPLGHVLALAGTSLLTFGLGLVFLRWKAGAAAPRFFFGRFGKEKPPSPRDFMAFKWAMYLGGLPWLMLPAVLVLTPQTTALQALATSLALAWAHLPALLLLTGLTVGLEALQPALARVLPKPAALAVSALLLPVLVLGILAMQYSLGVQWLGKA